MASGATLIFSGTRWPAARVSDRTSLVFKPHREPRTIFTLTAAGHGRRWEATEPQAFWRDFAEADFSDASAVTAFVQRRGDPEGLLDTSARQTHTGTWTNLKALLGTAAKAWEPADKRGVSRFTADLERVRLAEWFLRDNPAPILTDLEPVLDPSGRVPVFRAKTLASFMAVSAVYALARRLPMRKCEHCGSWLELIRKDARFCSASCRSLHSQQQRSEQ
jgi:hypothetical protein